MNLEQEIQDLEAELSGCAFDQKDMETFQNDLAILKMKYQRIMEDDDYLDDLTKEKRSSSPIVRNIKASIVLHWKNKIIKNVSGLQNRIKCLSSSIKNMKDFYKEFPVVKNGAGK